MNQELFSNDDTTVHARNALVSFYGFCLLVCSALLISCAPQNQGGADAGKSSDPYAHFDAEEKLAMSEVLADEGEEKLGFSTMNDAWGKFSEALQLNSENHRAALWKEILKPILETKGIIARVRPLYLKQENGLERYSALVRGTEKSSNLDYRNFMTEGPQNIDTDEKFIDFLDRTIVALDGLRSFVKANKDRTYSLRAPTTWIQVGSAKKKHGDDCAALTFMSTKFKGCAESGMLTFKMNRADLEAIQYIVSAEMMQLSLLYAYKVNPIAVLDTYREQTPKEKLESMLKGYDGSLMARNRLALGNSILADWIVAQRYFMQNQETVCRKGKTDDENRPGYLISSGFCLDLETGGDGRKNLEILETMALGKAIVIDQKFSKKTVKLYPMKFFNEPLSSIAPLVPTRYTDDGRFSDFSASAYSPFFAEGSIADISEELRLEDAHNAAETLRWQRVRQEWEAKQKAQDAEARRLQEESLGKRPAKPGAM